LLDTFKTKHQDILDEIRTTGKPVPDDRMNAAIAGAKASFQATA
jgi:hypothetical protein